MDPMSSFRRFVAPLIVLLLLCRHAAGGWTWCVARPDASEEALRRGIEYACGEGQANCSAIQPGGSCFEPNTLHDHASYAYNDYYQDIKPIIAPTYKVANCDFGGTAIVVRTDPSTATCKYPPNRNKAASNEGDHMGETREDMA